MLVFGTTVFPFETTLSQTLIAGISTEPAKDNQKRKLFIKKRRKKVKRRLH
jgi:hypothetical protein